MNRKTITAKRILTRARVRSKISGNVKRPRLSVHISQTNVRVQLVDDINHKTLVSVDTLKQKTLDKKTMSEKATWSGEQIAKKALAAKIDTVVFDRGWRIYHGRVKMLADAARTGGLKF